MQSYTLNRPDGALLCRVLEQHTNDAAGAILRLAWMAGLMRDEIQHLTWAQVDLLGEQLLLPDRAVPLAPELAAWLEALRRERNGSSERVVLSDRDQQPLAAQSISRLARAALDAGDLKAVRLIDLRHDYVLRQLERHDWQYVSRITGLEAAAMNVHFAAYLTEKKVSTRIRRKAAPQIDEFALWKLLQAEARSIPCSDGLPMLVAQAVAAEERFFNRSIPAGENERILVQLRREMTNLILIGMPGSGKTTVGEALSRLTGREAVDLDQMIETTAGCSIPEIFQREGESGFRARERAAAEEAGKRTGVILLTGGGIIKTAENYAALHQNGRIYQLVRDLSLLPTEGRPLSQGADLAAMWRERAPLYARFRDVEIDNSGTVEDTAAAIWRDFCAHSGS